MNKVIRATRDTLPTLLALAWGVAPNPAGVLRVLIERAEG